MELTHYPVSMQRFGANPYGQDLYRIIWAESRRHTAVAKHVTGSDVAREIPVYPGRTGWVMERWVPPFEFARCSPEEWNSNPILAVLGDYPHRGEYEACHYFEACGPVDANIDKLVTWIEESRKRPFAENLTACRKAAEQDEASRKSTKLDIIGNALPAFGSRPMSGPGGGRGTKTMPVQLTAQEAGLPTVGRTRPKPGQLSRSNISAL